MSDAEPRQRSREQSEGDVRPVKRSRTGCLTCRTRRRKCDETRPICQNCTVKGLECRYAAAFQFLGKNNYTPVVKNRVEYVNVEFVADGDEVSRDATGEHRLCEPSNDSVLNPTQSIAAAFRTRLDSPRTNLDILPQNTDLQPATGHTPSPNRYEFAVNGLLALSGTEPIFVPSNNDLELPQITPRQAASTRNESSHYERRADHTWRTEGHSRRQMSDEDSRGIAVADYAVFEPSITDHVEYQQMPQILDHEGTLELGSNVANFLNPMRSTSLGDITTDDDLGLIRLYRYQIAPSLDMCDASQPFGVMVLIASVKVPRVRQSILNLAQATKNKAQVVPAVNYDESEVVQHELQCLVPRIFQLLEKVATDLANFWEDKEVVQIGADILAMLVPQLNNVSDFAQAAYWLVVRLVLGCAIMSTSPLRMPLPFLAHSRLPSPPGAAVDESAQNAIALCVDAVMFSQGDDDRWLQQRYGSNRVEVWKTLLHGLGLWYRSRPQEFQPIIEMYPKDGIRHDHDFPTIIFTSGAALLANQLYHTAMMLLLQHKPRFDARIGSNSTSMSKMWHIHRICGIAINNDEPGSWDPCLVASFIVAARTVTHESQSSAVLRALQNVERLTGWSVLRHVEDLSI